MGNENIAEFSAAQFQKKLESIYNNLTKNKKTSELPKAYVLGGQPGAGKSSLIAKFKEEAQGNYETMQEAGTIPRATTKEQHDQTAGLIVENIGVVYEAKVFDNIQLYNRAGECLYNQVETPNLNPKTTMSHEHNRPLTMEESAQCKKELPVICKGMKERNDPRLSEVIKYSYEVGLVDVKHKAAREQSSNFMGMNAWKDAVDNPVKGISNAGRENTQMQIGEQETERN